MCLPIQNIFKLTRLMFIFRQLCISLYTSTLHHAGKIRQALEHNFPGDCYRPQTKFGARQYFCTCLSFCSQGGGGVPGQVHPPGRYPQQVHPWAGTSPGYVHSPSRYTPPWAGTPPKQVPPWQVPPAGTPPWAGTPPPMVNGRAVRILLECILV